MRYLALLLALLAAGPAFGALTGTSLTAKRAVTTVGALPVCNSAGQGAMYLVTDALVPVALATVAAGGAVKIGVTCDGTNWIVQ